MCKCGILLKPLLGALPTTVHRVNQTELATFAILLFWASWGVPFYNRMNFGEISRIKNRILRTSTTRLEAQYDI